MYECKHLYVMLTTSSAATNGKHSESFVLIKVRFCFAIIGSIPHGRLLLWIRLCVTFITGQLIGINPQARGEQLWLRPNDSRTTDYYHIHIDFWGGAANENTPRSTTDDGERQFVTDCAYCDECKWQTNFRRVSDPIIHPSVPIFTVLITGNWRVNWFIYYFLYFCHDSKNKRIKRCHYC